MVAILTPPAHHQIHPAWYAGMRVKMEARATLEQAEELRRVLDHLGERSADIWGKKKGRGNRCENPQTLCHVTAAAYQALGRSTSLK